jgi:ribosome maturation factor RimP
MLRNQEVEEQSNFYVLLIALNLDDCEKLNANFQKLLDNWKHVEKQLSLETKRNQNETLLARSNDWRIH